MVLLRETVTTGAPIRCDECNTVAELGIYQSGAGYYIGFWCNCGLYSKESGYYRTRKEAEKAFNSKEFSR